MTKKSPEKFLAICNTIASGITSYQRAAQMNDVQVTTFWNWVRASQRDPSDETLHVDFLGERLTFYMAVHSARDVALHEMRGRMEQKSILGWDEPVLYQGMPTFKPDLRCVGWSEDEREAYGFRRDGLAEDENGCVIPNTIKHMPSDALMLRVAEMRFPKEYRPGTTVEQNVTHAGVVGIQHSKPNTYSGGPPPIPAAPVPPPQLTYSPEQPEDDPELGDMLALPDAPEPVVDRAPEPEPEPVAAAPDIPVPSPAVPMGFADAPRREPRTPLEAELFAKLNAANKPKGNANV